MTNPDADYKGEKMTDKSTASKTVKGKRRDLGNDLTTQLNVVEAVLPSLDNQLQEGILMSEEKMIALMSSPNEDAVRILSYHLWENRGAPLDDTPHADWFMGEQLLSAELSRDSKAVGISLSASSDIYSRLRDLVVGIAGNVPEVGSALSGLVQFLWPVDSPTPEAVWNEMKQYATALVKDLISDEYALNLEKSLSGINNVLTKYNSLSYGIPAKGEWFTNALAAIELVEPYFFDDRNPEKTLPYFMGMGTLKLTLLREQYLFYTKIYNVTTDPDAVKNYAELASTIGRYSAAAKKSRDAALAWRLSFIKIGETLRTDFGILGPSTTHIWKAEDLYGSGWSESWEYNSLTGGTLDAEAKARYAYQNHLGSVSADFGNQLDRLLEPGYLWPYLDPKNPNHPNNTPVIVNSGPFGGRSGTPFQDNPAGQKISDIVVYAGSRVDGVEFFYGGRSGGLHGARSGTPNKLTLQPAESIVSAHGRAGDSMDQLVFVTNLGRQVGGGGGGGSAWNAAPPSGSDAALLSIAGKQGSRSFEGITLNWCYWIDK